MGTNQYVNVYRKGSRLLVREIDNHKQDILRPVWYKPHLYQRSGKETGYTDYFGKPVSKMTYENIYEMSKALKEYKDIPGEMWGNENPVFQFLQEEYPDTSSFDPNNLTIGYIDIEVNTATKVGDQLIDGGFPEPDEAKWPITAICQYNSNMDKFYMFTTAEWEKEKSILAYRDKIEYVKAKTEEDLIKKWLTFVERTKPHIWTGWNVDLFDFPYIVNRIRILFGEDEVQRLSVWGIVEEKHSKDDFGVEHTKYTIAGTPIIDMLDAYKKYCLSNREKYSLDYIMQAEFPNDETKRKLEFKETTHGELYYNNPQLHTDYCCEDVKCTVEIENARKFVFLCASLSYYAHINIGDNFSIVKLWDAIMYNVAETRNIAVPLKKHNEKEEYEGAHVFETKVGLHKALASFDAASMYPTCTRVLNCGFETLIKESEAHKHWKALCDLAKEHGDEEFLNALLKKNITDYFVDKLDFPEYFTNYLVEHTITMSPNCYFFDVSKQSIQAEVTAKLYYERKDNKKAKQVWEKYAEACEEELKRRCS